MTVLLLSFHADLLVQRLVRELERGSHDIFWFDPAADGRFSLEAALVEGRLRFSVHDRERCRSLDDREVSGIFSRMDVPHGAPGDAATIESIRHTVAALEHLLRAFHGPVVNRVDAHWFALAKPYQWRMIRDAGFRLPETVITNTPHGLDEAVSAFGGPEEVVYKSVSSIRSRVVRLSDVIQTAEHLEVAPVQLQRVVHGQNVRVHVVGEEVHASKIDASALDYRYTNGDAVGRNWVELPSYVNAGCVELTKAAGLAVSGIDLISSEDRWYCFEVNTQPYWAYFEPEDDLKITRAVARLLTTPTPDSRRVRARTSAGSTALCAHAGPDTPQTTLSPFIRASLRPRLGFELGDVR